MQAQLQTNVFGAVPGIYLKPERRSGVQFEGTYLSQSCPIEAATALERALDGLYKRHGEKNVAWYIERSLGLDVKRNVAWCNLDITDQIVP
jgi:hypothetical protein